VGDAAAASAFQQRLPLRGIVPHLHLYHVVPLGYRDALRWFIG
jgi:hypothetical protein